MGGETGWGVPRAQNTLRREHGLWFCGGAVSSGEGFSQERGITHPGGSTDRRFRNGCRQPTPQAGEGCRAQGRSADPPPFSHAQLHAHQPDWAPHLRLIPVAPFPTCSTWRGVGRPCLLTFHRAQW